MIYSLIGQTSGKNALNATLVYGYDTNPHQLSDIHSPLEQQFAQADFKYSERFFKRIYFRAKASKTKYFDDARADEFNGYASLALKSKFKIGKQKFRYKIAANYRSKDKTYVSKTTGLVATFGGQSIADRYDSTQLNYSAELTYKAHELLNFELLYQARNKEYQAFDIPGLSNLDYDHGRYRLGMVYKASDLGKFFMYGTFKRRNYVDRRGKDLNGADIPDTNLKYDYLSLDMGYIYRPNNKIRWRYTYNYEERRDSVSGYFNSTSGFISISASHQIGDYQFFTGKLKYSKNSLINQTQQSINPLDDENKDKQGGTVGIGYELVLATLFDTNFAFYIDLEYRNFKSSAPLFTYDRGVASAGIRWSAF